MKKKGLTLVELLVVIGIISVLVGIIIVIVNEVRWRTNIISCSSNLRQIGLALRMYAQDWLGFVPPYSNEYAGTGNDFYENQVTLLESAFEPYIKNKAIWLCPQDPDLGKSYGFTSYRIPVRYGYTAIAIDSPPIVVPADCGDPRYMAWQWPEGEPPTREDWWKDWIVDCYERKKKCIICTESRKNFGRWIYAECYFHQPPYTFIIRLFLSGNVIARRWPPGILHGCPAKQLPKDWPYNDLPH